ncbi:MAG TPA: hypothetical protein VGJ30_05105 [Candidatus Angelobacter sp.]
MTLAYARISIAAIFVGSLVVQIFAVFYCIWQKTIYWPDVTSFLIKLFEIYSVHFAVILAGTFVHLRGKATTGRRASGIFWLAASLSSVWNLLLVGRTVGFVLSSQDSIDDLERDLTAISSAGSFLVAGALTYFFSKSSEGLKPASEHSQ